jgi:hypothetical protein
MVLEGYPHKKCPRIGQSYDFGTWPNFKTGVSFGKKYNFLSYKMFFTKQLRTPL